MRPSCCRSLRGLRLLGRGRQAQALGAERGVTRLQGQADDDEDAAAEAADGLPRGDAHPRIIAASPVIALDSARAPCSHDRRRLRSAIESGG
jgi:hypothetical protein